MTNMTMQNNTLKAQEINAQVQYRLIEELSASEQRYRELVERIKEVVFKCDGQGVLQFLNSAWTSILGHPIAGSLNRSVVEFVFEEDRERAQNIVSRVRSGTVPEEAVEIRFERGDGEPVWLMMAVQTGESDGMVGSLYNIDERKRVQQELITLNEELETRVHQRTAELADSNRQLATEIESKKKAQENLLKAERLAVVGETSGRVAHEVLNPITSIYSRIEHNAAKWKEFSALLENSQEIISDWKTEFDAGSFVEYLSSASEEGGTYGEDDFDLLKRIFNSEAEFQKERQDDLQFITKQLQRVIKIINTMRGAVRQHRSVTEVCLLDPIEEAYDVLDDSLAKRRIKVVRKLPDELPPVLADENEIIQVFTNLFRNAMQSIDSMQRGGGFIETSAIVNGENIEIRVTDNGTGIAEENERYIFNFDFSTKDRSEGTGMGLGISRRFVRENGGEMILERSVEGKGATFLITLPTAQSKSLVDE